MWNFMHNFGKQGKLSGTGNAIFEERSLVCGLKKSRTDIEKAEKIPPLLEQFSA
jgi:hypothetical protein